MKAKFELRDKEITIALQNLKLEREKARINRYMISGLSLLLLFALSVVFLYSFWRKREQLKLAVHQKEEALSRNELLLREMHHRTKNNLQLLDSLLSLQARKTGNKSVKEAIQASKESVGAIGLLHHRLYETDNYSTVAMKPYLSDLAKYFSEAFGLKDRNIVLRWECDDLQLETDRSIPLGLIINELVTNSIKHAFVASEEGAVEISLKKTSAPSLLLRVRDNGTGRKVQSNESSGTGTELLKIFSHRFNARIKIQEVKPGIRIEFEMPLNQE